MTSVNWKSCTFIAGTTMSKASSPLARCWRQRLDVAEELYDALIEAEVSKPPAISTVPNETFHLASFRSSPSRMAQLPGCTRGESRECHCPSTRSSHRAMHCLRQSRCSRALPRFVRQRKSMAGRFDVGFCGWPREYAISLERLPLTNVKAAAEHLRHRRALRSAWGMPHRRR